jgi:hypothetical protein
MLARKGAPERDSLQLVTEWCEIIYLSSICSGSRWCSRQSMSFWGNLLDLLTKVLTEHARLVCGGKGVDEAIAATLCVEGTCTLSNSSAFCQFSKIHR